MTTQREKDGPRQDFADEAAFGRKEAARMFRELIASTDCDIYVKAAFEALAESLEADE